MDSAAIASSPPTSGAGPCGPREAFIEPASPPAWGPAAGYVQVDVRLTSPVPLPTRRPVAPCPRGPASTRPRPLPPPTWGATFASPARQSGTDEVSLRHPRSDPLSSDGMLIATRISPRLRGDASHADAAAAAVVDPTPTSLPLSPWRPCASSISQLRPGVPVLPPGGARELAKYRLGGRFGRRVDCLPVLTGVKRRRSQCLLPLALLLFSLWKSHLSPSRASLG